MDCGGNINEKMNRLNERPVKSNPDLQNQARDPK